MNRWAEYRAGTLIPPAIVQHDQIGDEHLIWVYAASGIVGPYSRRSYDEATTLAEIVESLTSAEEKENAEEVLA